MKIEYFYILIVFAALFDFNAETFLCACLYYSNIQQHTESFQNEADVFE
jgi:hypothetical protein